MRKTRKITDKAQLPYLDHFTKECIAAKIPVDWIIDMLQVITHKSQHLELYTMVWDYVKKQVPEEERKGFVSKDFNFRTFLGWYAIRQTTGVWPEPLKKIQDSFGASKLYDYGIDWHVDRMFRDALEKRLSIKEVKACLEKSYVYGVRQARVTLPKTANAKLVWFLGLIYPDAFLHPSKTAVVQATLKAYWKEIAEEIAKPKPVLPHSESFDPLNSNFYGWQIGKRLIQNMTDYTYDPWTTKTLGQAEVALEELWKTSIAHKDYRYITVAHFRYMGYEDNKAIAERGDIHNNNPETVRGRMPKGYKIARETIQHLVVRTIPDKDLLWKNARKVLIK